jgi:predicted transcriptional regulator
MATKTPDEKNRLTIYLPEDLARRLKLVAVSQNKAASNVVAELLDKYLPRLEIQEQKDKKKIPYT